MKKKKSKTKNNRSATTRVSAASWPHSVTPPIAPRRKYSPPKITSQKLDLAVKVLEMSSQLAEMAEIHATQVTLLREYQEGQTALSKRVFELESNSKTQMSRLAQLECDLEKEEKRGDLLESRCDDLEAMTDEQDDRLMELEAPEAFDGVETTTPANEVVAEVDERQIPLPIETKDPS